MNELPPPPAEWKGITPEQWGAEVCLWEIPEKEWQAAYRYEKEREIFRLRGEVSMFNGTAGEVAHYSTPWLMQSESFRRGEMDAFFTPITPLKSKWLANHSKAKNFALPGDGYALGKTPLTRFTHEEAGKEETKPQPVYALVINPEAGRNELLKAFEAFLDGEGLGNAEIKGQGKTHRARFAVWLALLSLHRLFRCREDSLAWWKPLANPTLPEEFRLFGGLENNAQVNAMIERQRWFKTIRERLGDGGKIPPEVIERAQPLRFFRPVTRLFAGDSKEPF